MAIKPSTNRIYESQFAAAVAQGFTGTYADFAKIQSSPARKKAPAAENVAPKTSNTDASAGVERMQSFEELLELVLLKPEQRTKAFSTKVDELLKASPTLKHLAAKLDTRLNSPPKPEPAAETAAPTESVKVNPTKKLEDFIGLMLNKPKMQVGDFNTRFDELFGDSPTLRTMGGMLNDRLNPAPKPEPAAEPVKPEPEETPRQREERLREERRMQMNNRFGRHKVIDNVTMCVMRGYVPNFSHLPSGYILAVHRELGTVHPFYFRLYNDAELQPNSPQGNMNRFGGFQPGGQFGGQGQMYNGPMYGNPDPGRGRANPLGYRREERQMEGRSGYNEMCGLENYGPSQAYLNQRISEVANSLFNDDVFFCQEVYIAPLSIACDQPLRLMGAKGQYSPKDQDKFSIDGLMHVTLEEIDGYNPGGWESNIRVYFPGVEKDEHRTYRMQLTVPFPEKFVATDCSAHWLAREIARRLAYTHPSQIGCGVVILELGGEFTKHEPRAAEVVL